jgi:hypothetical protein
MRPRNEKGTGRECVHQEMRALKILWLPNQDSFSRVYSLFDTKIECRNNQTNICCNDLFEPNCDLKLSFQNPAVMIPRIYNAPLDIKMIECEKLFAKIVKAFVTEKQFYDIHEFFSCQ